MIGAHGMARPLHIICERYVGMFSLVQQTIAHVPWGSRGKALSDVARQSGWESSDNQDGHFGGRGEVMIVAARR